MLTRRALLEAGGFWLAGLALPGPTGAAAPVDIRMMSDTLGTAVWFDPIGVRIEPGRTVRFIVHANVHTTAAYHPRNDHHSLRIPEGAEPWDSGFLINPGSHFEVTLTVPGVYDYFCAPHEAAGVVGRLVVGRPAVRARFRSTTSRGSPAPKPGSLCPGRRRPRSERGRDHA